MEINYMELFSKTLEVNGKMSQLKQLAEECNEAALAVRKLERAIEEEPFAGSEPIKKREEELVREIADLAIMVVQASVIYGEERIQTIIPEKLEKCQNWLNKKINSIQ